MYTASFAVRGKPDPRNLKGFVGGRTWAISWIQKNSDTRPALASQRRGGEPGGGELAGGPGEGRKEDIVKDEPVDRRFRTPLGKPALDIERFGGAVPGMRRRRRAIAMLGQLTLS
eukprot:tig00020965_g16843.t1